MHSLAYLGGGGAGASAPPPLKSVRKSRRRRDFVIVWHTGIGANNRLEMEFWFIILKKFCAFGAILITSSNLLAYNCSVYIDNLGADAAHDMMGLFRKISQES